MSSSNPRLPGLKPALLSLVATLTATGATMSVQAQAAAPADTSTIAVITSYIPTFGAAVTRTGLAAVLDGAGPYTLFVPDEGAFARLPAGVLTGMMTAADRSQLQSLVRAHVVQGKVSAADLNDGDTLVTLDGGTLTVRRDAAGVTINGARLTTADLAASNGVIHVVRTVLSPVG